MGLSPPEHKPYPSIVETAFRNMAYQNDEPLANIGSSKTNLRSSVFINSRKGIRQNLIGLTVSLVQTLLILHTETRTERTVQHGALIVNKQN